jgi:hypothetical protein
MFIDILILLILGHFVADYPLQGDFLSKAKNRYNPIPGIPAWQALSAHSFIHSGFVYLITGSIYLLFVEFVIHWLTDDQKCKGNLTFNQDQAIHIITKVFIAIVYVGIIV